MRLGGICGSQQLGMHARASHASEVQVKALGAGRPELGWNQFNLRIGRPQFREAFFPEAIKVLRARVPALIGFQLFKWKIEGERHSAPLGSPPGIQAPGYCTFPMRRMSVLRYSRLTPSPHPGAAL